MFYNNKHILLYVVRGGFIPSSLIRFNLYEPEDDLLVGRYIFINIYYTIY